MFQALPPAAELARLFALAHGPAAGAPPAAPLAPAAGSRGKRHQRAQRTAQPQLLYLNFQMLNSASDSDFLRVCRLAVRAHAAAFDPSHLDCLCADPAGVGAAC